MNLEFTFFGTDEDLGNLYFIPSELSPKNCKICGAPPVIASAGYSQAVFCSKNPSHNFTPWILCFTK